MVQKVIWTVSAYKEHRKIVEYIAELSILWFGFSRRCNGQSANIRGVPA